MGFAKRFPIRDDQRPRSNSLRSTPQPIVVHQRVREEHDLLVHPVLVDEVDHGFRVSFGQTPEQGHVKSALPRFWASDQWWKLEVIANEHKAVRKLQRSQTSWEGDLGRFVDNAVIESSAGEERANKAFC